MFWKFRAVDDGSRWTIYDHKGSAADDMFGLGGEPGSDPDRFFYGFIAAAIPGAIKGWALP
mgnify:CR=1 FL=1|jgi:hypothetical protein